MSTRVTRLLVLAFCFGCAPARAQPAGPLADAPVDPLAAPVRFDHLDPRAGLSHNTVFAILQDRQGFLWFGTADGLNRYDGYTFVVYRHDPADTSSLSGNTVRALLEDRAGDLWVATESGLDRLDRAAGRFVRYPFGPGCPRLQGPWGLLEDPAGAVWVGYGQGLRRVAPETGQSRCYLLPTADPMPGYLYSMGVDRAGTIWAGRALNSTAAGLFRFDPGADSLVEVALPDDHGQQMTVHVGPSGRLLVTSGLGLGTLDPSGYRFAPLHPGLRTLYLLETRAGVVWAATGHDGLVRFDPATGRAERHRLDASGTSWLARSVRALYEDRAGTVWVGTLGGVFRYDPHAKPFTHLTRAPGQANTLSSSVVTAIYEDAAGVRWVGTLGGGLNRVEPEGRITAFRHRAEDPASLPDDNVWAIHEDRRGTLWIGTDGGLCAFDRRRARCRRHALDPAGPAYVNVLAEDAGGALWAGGPDLYRIDPQTGAVARYPLVVHDDTRPSGRIGNVQALYFDASGVLWVGTEFNGLVRFEPGTGHTTWFPPVSGGEGGIWGNAVRVIHGDAATGRLWLGTDMGLVAFDRDEEAQAAGTFRHYLSQGSFQGSNVYGILQDDAGRLWVSTNAGLHAFDPDAPPERAFTRYDAADGTGITEYNRRAAFRSRTGVFFFGGMGGVTAFVPGAIRDNPHPPPVVLTAIRTSSRSGTVELRPEQVGREGLRLAPTDYSFSFEFAALSYTQPQDNRYAYRLEGFDRDWVEAGTRRFASYTHVPPGTYTFRVKGSNNDGVWNETGAALRVVVAPPVWGTWWFRLLAGAAVAGLVAAVYRARVAHLLALERLRLRIASDLHDDLGSKLSSIALMSEMIRDGARLPEGDRAQLTRIGQVARQLAESVRDLVWFVAPDHEKPGEMTFKLKNEAAALLGNVDVTFEAPEHTALDLADMVVRRNLFLLYKEALHNVARHAGARAVRVTLREDPQHLVLCVADDGAGFDPAAGRRGHGLRSMRERAAQIGAELDVASRPGAGTTVCVTIRITRLRNGMRRRRVLS